MPKRDRLSCRDVPDTISNDRRALIALWAVIGVCRQLQTPKKRAEFLLNRFTEDPWLIKYFRACYDQYRHYTITSADTLGKLKIKKDQEYPEYNDLLELLRDLTTSKMNRTTAILAWRKYMHTLPEDMRPVACHVLDRDMCCGVSHATLNKVLERMGKKPVYVIPDTMPVPDVTQLKLEITSIGVGGVDCAATAVLFYGGERVANIVWAMSPRMRLSLAVLRAAGIAIECPDYMSKEKRIIE